MFLHKWDSNILMNTLHHGKVQYCFIQLCGTITPCVICGSEDVKNVIEEHLGVKNGGTTKDGLFALLEVQRPHDSAQRQLLRMPHP